MLIVEKKDRATASRGPVVTWNQPVRSASISSGIVEGYELFVRTFGIVDEPLWGVSLTSPSPYLRATAKLEDLLALKPGWDGHDAAAVAPPAVARAIEFLRSLEINYHGAVDSPLVGPLADGGVALVWRRAHQEVEINFLASGEKIEYAISDRNGNREPEFHEQVGMEFLLSALVPQHLLA